jgi:hypothetical protein
VDGRDKPGHDELLTRLKQNGAGTIPRRIFFFEKAA